VRFIRDIKIRTVLITILITFSLLWAGVSGFALYSLNQLKSELNFTNVQQQNGDIINGANAQYYRAVTALERAIAGLEKNNNGIYDIEIKDTLIELESLKKGLDQFKNIDHGNLDSNTVDDIYNSSFTLFNSAVFPMYESAAVKNTSLFASLKNDKYLPLRRNFSAAIENIMTKLPLLTLKRITELPSGLHGANIYL